MMSKELRGGCGLSSSLVELRNRLLNFSARLPTQFLTLAFFSSHSVSIENSRNLDASSKRLFVSELSANWRQAIDKSRYLAQFSPLDVGLLVPRADSSFLTLSARPFSSSHLTLAKTNLRESVSTNQFGLSLTDWKDNFSGASRRALRKLKLEPLPKTSYKFTPSKFI